MSDQNEQEEQAILLAGGTTKVLLELHRLQQMEHRILALMEEYADSPMLSMTNVWKAVHG